VAIPDESFTVIVGPNACGKSTLLRGLSRLLKPSAGDLHHVGHTLVAVLHDLNHAARYGTHLIVMKDGNVVALGPPEAVVTADLVEEVFGLRCLVVPDPVAGTPQVVPLGRERTRQKFTAATSSEPPEPTW
jgi:ABC-type cobalamin/Fe3+-siderophores transport system ATPase subunit